MLLIWLENPTKISKEKFAQLLFEISDQAVKVYYRKLKENPKIKFKEEMKER